MTVQETPHNGWSAGPQQNDPKAVGAEKAKDLASSASDTAGQMAGTAKEQIGEIGSELAAQARSLAHETKSQVRTEIDSQADRLQQTMRGWAGELRALEHGSPEEATTLRPYLGEVAGRLEGAAQRVERGGPEGLLRDLEGFARRRPGVFLFGAAVLGFGLGRVVRGARASQSQQGNGRGNGWSSPDGYGTGAFPAGASVPPAAPPLAHPPASLAPTQPAAPASTPLVPPMEQGPPVGPGSATPPVPPPTTTVPQASRTLPPTAPPMPPGGPSVPGSPSGGPTGPGAR